MWELTLYATVDVYIVQVAEHLEVSHKHHDHCTAPVQKTQLIRVPELGMTFMSRKCD